MFLVRRPSRDAIEAFLMKQEKARLSYEPVGLSTLSPSGFAVDGHREIIGHGLDALAVASEALWNWKMFELGWLEIHPAHVRVREGCNVAVLARHLGFWSLNACRVVRCFSESSHGEACGFAYGTLEDHAERGEELFRVKLDPADQSVWYEIRAVSRPGALLTWLGYPISRRLQARFRQDSAWAMRKAVERAASRARMPIDER